MKNFNIITELINYNNKKIPTNSLIISFETLGKEKLDIFIKNLLFWQKIIYTSPTIANKGKITNKDFYLIEDTTMIDEYKILFQTCPELTDFFILKKNRIILNDTLSMKDIDILRKMIDDGYKLSIKINIGKSE